MRVTLFIQTLLGGGAERVISAMANYWAAHGHVTHVISRPSAQPDFYPLHPEVRRVYAPAPLPSVHGARYVLRVHTLRDAIVRTRPDVVISFMNTTNVETLLATRGLGIPVVVSERCDPRMIWLPRHHELLRRLLYPHAAAVVVQTESVRRWAKVVPPSKLAVIPNFVYAPPPSPPVEREPVVVAIGRLTAQKGFDLLVHAFARVAARAPEWRMVIFGQGERRSMLERQVAALGLAGRVALPGLTSDPSSHLRRAGMFVLSSRHEGFPNALLEAMACGAPVIATDCPSGPSEIVRDGYDGLLVPVGVEPLAAAMLRLMQAPEERARLGAHALEVTARFHPDRIMAAWDEVLLRGVAASAKRSANFLPTASSE